MTTIKTPNELHFMQSFEIDPKKQKYGSARVPEENTHDISSLGWKTDLTTLNKFLVYMNEKALYITILQGNDVIFDKRLSIDLETPTEFDFELLSESKIIIIFFFLWLYVREQIYITRQHEISIFSATHHLFWRRQIRNYF